MWVKFSNIIRKKNACKLTIRIVVQTILGFSSFIQLFLAMYMSFSITPPLPLSPIPNKDQRGEKEIKRRRKKNQEKKKQ